MKHLSSALYGNGFVPHRAFLISWRKGNKVAFWRGRHCATATRQPPTPKNVSTIQLKVSSSGTEVQNSCTYTESLLAAIGQDSSVRIHNSTLEKLY